MPARLRRAECSHCETFHGIGSYNEVLNLLMDCNPTIALRTIRVTREKGVQSDAEETSRSRRRALARCHQLLGRGEMTLENMGPSRPQAGGP